MDIGQDFEGFEDGGGADEHGDKADESEQPGDHRVFRLGGGEHGFFGLHTAGDSGDAVSLAGGVFFEGVLDLARE